MKTLSYEHQLCLNMGPLKFDHHSQLTCRDYIGQIPLFYFMFIYRQLIWLFWCMAVEVTIYRIFLLFNLCKICKIVQNLQNCAKFANIKIEITEDNDCSWNWSHKNVSQIISNANWEKWKHFFSFIATPSQKRCFRVLSYDLCFASSVQKKACLFLLK